MAKITEDLKKHFEVSPGKKSVWVNEAGEWSNFPRKDYPTEVTRAQAFGAKAEAPKKEAVKPDEAVKEGAPKKEAPVKEIPADKKAGATKIQPAPGADDEDLS